MTRRACPCGSRSISLRVEQRAGRGDQIHRLHPQRLQYRGRFRQAGAHVGPGRAGKFHGIHSRLQIFWVSGNEPGEITHFESFTYKPKFTMDK